jgi:5-hydroxyisourate hydrolase
MTVSHITTHILDTAAGKPAEGVSVRLEARGAEGWTEIGSGTTDADGRVKNLGPEKSDAGDYRIEFATGEYFEREGVESFFPFVSLAFSLRNPEQHYHVPLLISPFAYSTYRGS